jgi:hypothetical protein
LVKAKSIIIVRASIGSNKPLGSSKMANGNQQESKESHR